MIHHLAIAPKDFKVSHKFYTEAMGFKLAKVIKRQALGGEKAGWTKHVFYDMGDETYFALWDLHLTELEGREWKSAWSSGLGLPTWINHVAFQVASEEELLKKRQLWLDYGLRVSQVVHETITSIYTLDPDKNLVEFTVPTATFTPEDLEEAERILFDDTPADVPEYPATMYEPEGVSVRTK